MSFSLYIKYLYESFKLYIESFYKNSSLYDTKGIKTIELKSFMEDNYGILIQKGEIEDLKKVIRTPHVNTRDALKNLLCTSIEAGRIDLVKYSLTELKFLDRFQPPEVGDRIDFERVNFLDHVNNLTPLHLASYYGQADIVELLFEEGARNLCTDKGPYALLFAIDLAIYAGHSDVVSKLLEHDAEFKFIYRQNILPPLHLACALDQPQIAKLLVEKGAEPTDKIREGYFKNMSALDLVIKFGSTSVALELDETGDLAQKALAGPTIYSRIKTNLNNSENVDGKFELFEYCIPDVPQIGSDEDDGYLDH